MDGNGNDMRLPYKGAVEGPNSKHPWEAASRPRLQPVTAHHVLSVRQDRKGKLKSWENLKGMTPSSA